jgi:AhpD family alkylhydroperoxidase
MSEPRFPAQWRGLRPHKLLKRLELEPTLGEAFERLGRALVDELPPRMLETIALRVSARRDCRYIWAGHVAIAFNHPEHPLSIAEIARIAYGSSALRGSDALLVRAVDELLDQSLSRSAQAALGTRAPRVTLATGFYDTIAALMHDVEPERDVPVIPGLETPSLAARLALERAA